SRPKGPSERPRLGHQPGAVALVQPTYRAGYRGRRGTRGQVLAGRLGHVVGRQALPGVGTPARGTGPYCGRPLGSGPASRTDSLMDLLVLGKDPSGSCTV